MTLQDAFRYQQSASLVDEESVPLLSLIPSSIDDYAGECKKAGKILASFVDPRQSFGPDKVIPPSILANAKVRISLGIYDFVEANGSRVSQSSQSSKPASLVQADLAQVWLLLDSQMARGQRPQRLPQ